MGTTRRTDEEQDTTVPAAITEMQPASVAQSNACPTGDQQVEKKEEISGIVISTLLGKRELSPVVQSVVSLTS